MKLLIFLFTVSILVAQPSTPPSVIHVTSDPAGSCSASMPLRFNTANGKLWGCDAGTWTQIGGGAPSGSAGGDLSGTYPNPSVIKINGTSLAGLATGILKNTTTTGVPSIAAAADVTSLFSGCSGTQYLGADGACHTASGGSPGSPSASVQVNDGAGGFQGMTNWSNDSTNATLAVSLVPDPAGALTVALAGAGAGNVDNGDHCYAVTFFVRGDVTLITFPGDFSMNTVTVADKTINGKVSITDIPVSADSRVTGRVLYRTKAGKSCNVAGDADFFNLDSIFDNTTTTYIDNTADSGLAVLSPVYFDFANTTGSISVGGNYFSLGSRPILAGAVTGSSGVLFGGSVGSSGLVQAVPDGIGALMNDGTGVYSYQSGGMVTVAFANLSTTNGVSQYCSDCKVTSGSDNTCVGSGSGAMAVRIAGVSKCVQ